MTYTFSVLHISDLHERGPRENEPYRRYRVLGDVWRQNLDELTQEGGVDMVCFTGDLADHGKAEEYQKISEFLAGLVSHLKLDRSRLFVVPGNHDIDRSIAPKEWRHVRDNLGEAKSSLAISRWMAGGAAPFGFLDAERDAVLSRQASFRSWLKQFGLAAQSPDTSGRLLGYRLPLRLPHLPFPVHVIGLDSAWLAGDDADARRLRLTDGQVQSLCNNPLDGRALDGFRLALIHHPLSDLADGSECQPLLGQSLDLILRGHLHETTVDLLADPDLHLRTIAAGCLYEHDRYPNACILLRVTCDAAGRPLRYVLRFRSFAERGFWCDNTRLYRGAPHGSMTIVPPPPPPPPPPHPHPQPQPQPQPQPPPPPPPPPPTAVVVAHPLPPGTQIDDYRIVKQLGQGGMGAVYEAVKVSIDRRVAIKFLYGTAAGQADSVRRFFNEARSSSRIEHPAIVEVFDVGEAPDGSPYLVMELVRGETLSSRLRRLSTDGAKLSVTQALQFTWQVADALTATHSRGIVHRDLKPDNIMLVPDAIAPGGQRVRLLDFGIAKRLQGVTVGQPATADNQLLGTPMYMSPEQCRSAATVDVQSDVYSLGVILYELLAGRPPFQAEQWVQFLTQHLMESPPPLSSFAPSLPTGLPELVHEMLDKDKTRRPTMSKVAERLRGYLVVSEIARHPPHVPVRYKRLLLLGGVLLPLTGFASFTGIRFYLKQNANPTPASQSLHPTPPRTVRWRIDSDPQGAAVIGVDGQERGMTPWEGTLEARSGTTQLQLKLRGYETASLPIDQSRDGSQKVTLTPTRVPGTIIY